MFQIYILHYVDDDGGYYINTPAILIDISVKYPPHTDKFNLDIHIAFQTSGTID